MSITNLLKPIARKIIRNGLLQNRNNVFIRNMGEIYNRDKYWLDRIGNREIVGFGMNGLPGYYDKSNFPFPAIRYKETTTHLQSLLEKQKCNWKLLSIEEKKELYRANFCLTFAEFQAPTGEWMEILGYVLIYLSLSLWIWIFLRLNLDGDVPESFTPSNKRAQLRRQLDLKMNPIEGLASWWDYEKNDWKPFVRNPPPSPFCQDDYYDD